MIEPLQNETKQNCRHIIWDTPYQSHASVDDVIKWKHFPYYWPFVRGIHRPPVNSLHKGQWGAALMFSLICTWINGWVNNCKAGDLRHSLWCHCNVLMFSWMSAYGMKSLDELEMYTYHLLLDKVPHVKMYTGWSCHFTLMAFEWAD